MLALAAPYLNASLGSADIAILGVTPEVVQLGWPAHVRLHAFDMSAEMIAKVWRPHPNLPSSVRELRWQDLPLADNAVACAVGDGSLNCLQGLSEYPEVLHQVARALRPNGALIMRMFIRPDTRATLEEVEAAVADGTVETFHALKWHVAMALAEAPEYAVRVTAIRDAIIAIFPDREKLASARGWPREAIDTIDSYEGAETRYNFPTLEAVRNVSSPSFEMVEIVTGNYEIAERCPTLLFKPR